ncbi:hypothetical protein I302_108400 [Kwoniella bestiolae CBS 10118]|uniref:Uncharacterized protein n=1 Tax=Kwoniella bestiolae CBS 10118 TaxID=1296100 RepID=A0A1B9FVS8_9TREE|nr:hypothetical protein I302_07226 [Kwoniella bestiolae CBS 10118]OCF22879.1 hypothetical protein I302_07226 [Kwoniella bestiolae CBS 10118]
MDQQNRLLAMLKSATTVPDSTTTSSSSPHGSINSNSTHQSQYLTASNLGSVGSPREPSPSPPPPSLQAVSLLDLFKNISSPPPPTASSERSNSDDQKNKLLGMLNQIGQATPNAGVISPSQGSHVGTPTTQGEKGDPLAVFKAGHPSHPPASPTGQGPIINHPSGITSPHAKPVQSQHTGTSTSSSQAQAQAKSAKIDEKPVPPTNETPKKSMFHFDSPFDAFEQLPRSRQASTANKPATPKEVKIKLDDDHPLNRIKSVEKIQGNGKASPQRGEPPLQTDKKPYEPPATFTVPVAVNELPQAEIEDKLRNTWQIGKVVKDGQGKGPKALTPHTTIDLSQPNLGSLVNTGNPVQIAPTTKMRTDFMTYKKGRRVGITNTYMAYTMSKGRVRLIDSSSGARLVIELPVSAAHGPVVDLAVTSNYVATIGWDKAIHVYKVPVNGWKQDDPNVELVFWGLGVTGPIGWPTKIEWVKREGKDWLAIAGSEGVVLVDPVAQGRGGSVTSIEIICKDSKILKTDGDVVDFCLNQSHQAIGLLSSTSYCTLYNVSNLNRVWHRPLPSASPTSAPSSIQFCESNILVGRAKNSHYDLIQITVDLAVLSTIEFVAPSPCLEELNYSHAVYDNIKSTLYIAPFARGSLYAFKYALKGQQPVKDASKPDGPKVTAFDKVAEYPLEPVISLILAKKGVEEDSEIFCATPQGFSQATIMRSAYDTLKAPLQPARQLEATAPATTATTKAVPSPKSPKGGKIELPKPKSNAGSKAASKNTSPAVVKTELPSTSEDDVAAQPRPKVQSRKGSIAPIGADGEELAGIAVTQDELSKTLKKTEDRLSNHLKQLLKNEIAALNVRLDGLTGPDFAADISARVERQIKGSLNTTIVQEIKKTVVPAAASTIQNEVRTVTSNQVPAAIYDALQTVPKELERSLAPVVQRTISNLVSNAMDKAVHEAIQHTLLPAMTQASSSVVEQLSAEMRSEMLQIRKELSPPSKAGQLANDHLLKTMSTSISELQKQVATLTEHLKSVSGHAGPNGVTSPHHPSSFAPFPSAPAAAHHQAPPPPIHHQQPPPPPPTQPAGPSPSQLEDTFLSALGAQTTASTLQLVNDHLSLTDYCLPSQGKSPLSQAVLLTLLHRLAIVLSEIPSTHAMFQQVAGWERRTALLVDPKDQNIAGYISRVLSVVQGQLTTVLNNLQRYPDANTQSYVVVIRGIMEIIGHKMNL